MFRSSIALLVLFGSVSIARAQEPARPMLPMMPPTSPTTVAAEPEKPLHASITFSPIHLIFPVFELAAEIAIQPKFGVAVIGAAGTVTPENSDQSVFVYEVGISPRFYVVGNFRQGIELGAEAVYLHGSADGQVMSTVTADGLSIGPYAGYKWVASMGLTLEAQLGAQYIAIRSDSISDDVSRFAVLLNLQVGWSF